MEHYDRKLVDIICESILEKDIIDLATKLGVNGYTILEARGSGAKGERFADMEFNKNIKIEIICGNQTAEKLCQKIKERFFADYAVVIYQSNVEVLRSEKFS